MHFLRERVHRVEAPPAWMIEIDSLQKLPAVLIGTSAQAAFLNAETHPNAKAFEDITRQGLLQSEDIFFNTDITKERAWSLILRDRMRRRDPLGENDVLIETVASALEADAAALDEIFLAFGLTPLGNPSLRVGSKVGKKKTHRDATGRPDDRPGVRVLKFYCGGPTWYSIRTDGKGGPFFKPPSGAVLVHKTGPGSPWHTEPWINETSRVALARDYNLAEPA